MFARLFKAMHLTRGQKAVATAYGTVMAVSAGITLLIMSAIEGVNAIPPEPTLFDNWVIAAGALAAGLAFYLSRHWIGGRGALGLARAVVSTVMVTIGAALIGGTLIAPFYGTLAGPFVVLSEFLSNPMLAAAWFVILMSAHFMVAIWRDEQEIGLASSAVSHLSQLSQANLYRHTYRH